MLESGQAELRDRRDGCGIFYFNGLFPPAPFLNKSLTRHNGTADASAQSTFESPTSVAIPGELPASGNPGRMQSRHGG